MLALVDPEFDALCTDSTFQSPEFSALLLDVAAPTDGMSRAQRVRGEVIRDIVTRSRLALGYLSAVLGQFPSLQTKLQCDQHGTNLINSYGNTDKDADANANLRNNPAGFVEE